MRKKKSAKRFLLPLICCVAVLSLLGFGASQFLSGAPASADSQAAGPAPVAATGEKWSNASTWGGKVPGAGEVATIPSGKTVVLDVVTPALKGVVVKGALVASGSGTIGITADYVAVNGGRLQIGTAADPFIGKAIITLTGTSTTDSPATPGMGTKVLAVNGGILDLHGARVITNWTKLAADVAPGATTLTLAAAPGWKTGDRIVIAPSTANQATHDVATIASVNGTQVTLTAPLKYKHFGATQTVGDVTMDVRAEVGLLSHNILIQGDDKSVSARIGAHTMIMGKSTARIENVEITKAGQLNQLGRYPLHFHMIGSQCTECYVKKVSVHDTIQRGIVLHATSNVLLDGNVVYNTVGHNIIVETPDTTGNTITNNLALVNHEPIPVFTEKTLITQNDKITANFWFKSSANTVSGNVAAGSFSNGYTYDDVGAEPINFTKNVAHAAMTQESIDPGDFDVKAALVLSSQDRRTDKDEISGMFAYQSGVGLWPEEGGGPWHLKNFVVAENELQVENRGVGGVSIYSYGTWVQKLPKGDAQKDYRMMHIQYGGDVTIDHPHIVGYSKIALDGGDTDPNQATYLIKNPTFSGSKPAWDINDMVVAEFNDSAAVPAGSYVTQASPFLYTPACTPATGSLTGFVRCPKTYNYTELDIRDGAALGTSVASTLDLVRSDGLKYHQGSGSEDAKGSGQFATTVSYDNGLSYTLAKPSTNGYAVGLSVTFQDGGPLSQPVLSEKATVEVAIPMNSAPSSVIRSNQVSSNGGLGAVPPTTPSTAGAIKLAQVSSLEALRKAPLTSYYYDAGKKQVVVHASARWVIVKP